MGRVGGWSGKNEGGERRGGEGGGIRVARLRRVFVVEGGSEGGQGYLWAMPEPLTTLYDDLLPQFFFCFLVLFFLFLIFGEKDE